MNNGKVLVAGGLGATYLSSAELYDPSSGTWTNTGSMAAARDFHTATLLLNGNVVVAGGFNGVSYLSSAELYSPPSTFQITSVVRTNAHDLLITWNTGGTSNIVQVATGSFSINGFTQVTNLLVTTTTTNFLDVGAATNSPARYYRIRSPQ